MKLNLLSWIRDVTMKWNLEKNFNILLSRNYTRIGIDYRQISVWLMKLEISLYHECHFYVSIASSLNLHSWHERSMFPSLRFYFSSFRIIHRFFSPSNLHCVTSSVMSRINGVFIVFLGFLEDDQYLLKSIVSYQLILSRIFLNLLNDASYLHCSKLHWRILLVSSSHTSYLNPLLIS